MNELSFLLELLLEHTLEKVTQTLIKERVQLISSMQLIGAPAEGRKYIQVPRDPLAQAPSILAKYPDLAIPEQVVPVEQIAQNPATAKALADRQALIAQSMSGKPLPGQTAPRKLGRQ